VQIGDSDKHAARADVSNHAKFALDSKVTALGFFHSQKRSTPPASTDGGMQIDESNEH
jgi:hypothetical protein